MERSKGKQSVIRVLIPAIDTPDAVTLKISVDGGALLEFSDPFQYLEPPQPSILTVTPTSASISGSSRTIVTVKNFPKVSTANDVLVRFQWDTTSTGVVVSAVRSLGGGAVQTVEIEFQSPVGPDVKEGRARILVFHPEVLGEIAPVFARDSFVFLDPVKPLVAEIRSGAEKGVSHVLTPMSGNVDISLKIEKAPKGFETGAAIIKLADKQMGIVASSPTQVTEDREANFVFTSMPAGEGVEYGLILFGDDPGTSTCTPSCCASASCNCGAQVKSACFSLEYFDNTLPAVTVQGDLVGPEIGGHVISLDIVNFVTLTANADLSVMYRSGDIEEMFDVIEIVSSNEAITELLLVTPEFKGVVPTGKMDQTIEIILQPREDPRKSVTLSYVVEAVQATVISVNPSFGPSSGGSKVTVEIDYFQYPTKAKIVFDGQPLPESNVALLGVSSKLKTKIQFTIPAMPSQTATYSVVASPVVCATPCTKAVTFEVEVYDDSLPELEVPPSGTAFQKTSLPTLRIRKSPAPADIQALFVVFDKVEAGLAAAQGAVEQAVDVSALKEADVVSITAPFPPQIDAAGAYMVSLRFELKNGVDKTSTPFKFVVFDGFAARVIQMTPNHVATSATFEGRKLNLRTKISLVCANVPSDLKNTDMLAILSPSSEPAQVLQVKNLVTCAPDVPDCTRTLIVLQLPALDVSGVESLEISRLVPGSAPEQLVMSHVTFQTPCDHAKFCRESGMIVNYKKLTDSPALECSPELCLDATLIPDPVVVGFSPRAGGAGTEVTVMFKDLAAFDARDITVIVHGSQSKTRASVSRLEQRATSTLLSSEGTLDFEAPSFASPDDFATIEISVMVAGRLRVASFQFEYLPEITGSAVLKSFMPNSIMEDEDLNLYVTVENVHRIDFPFTVDRKQKALLVELNGAEYAPEHISIVSSDRRSTSLSISVPASVVATLTKDCDEQCSIVMGIGSRLQGPQNLVDVHVDIHPPPEPALMSAYPSLDQAAAADIEHILSVKMAYLPPSLASLDAWNRMASMTNISPDSDGEKVEIVEVLSMMDQECSARFCSMIQFKLRVPALHAADQGNGGSAEISLTSKGAPVQVAFGFVFKFKAAGAPSIELVQPMALALEGKVPVTVFLKNFPNAVCKTNTPPTCGKEATDGGVTIGFVNPGLSSPVDVTAKDSNGMLLLTFTADSSEVAADEDVEISLGGTSIIKFSIKYTMPPAGANPMDGRMKGGDTIIIEAHGWFSQFDPPKSWSASDMTDNDFHVQIGDSVVDAGSIVSVEQVDGIIMAQVEVPASSKVGQVSGMMSAYQGKSMSRFMFEYFKAPTVVSITPNKATLLGKTSSDDGESVLVTIVDFPPVSSSSDVQVSFGNTICGAKGNKCRVVSVRSSKVNGAVQVQLRVVVPSVTSPGEVAVKVEYLFAKGSPKIAIFSPREPSQRFSFYKPAPVVLSARWCAECKSADARTCIVMGSCGGGKAPLENLVPMSGGGVMIVTMDNAPSSLLYHQINGTTTAKMVLALGDSNYGEFVRVAKGDGTVTANGYVANSNRVVLEFSIPALFSPAGDMIDVSIKPPGSLSASSGSISFSFFDDAIRIECLHGCEAAATGQQKTVLALTNFPLVSDFSLFDQLTVEYGGFEVSEMEIAGDPYDGADLSTCSQDSMTCIQVTQPECVGCMFEDGALIMDLSVVMKADATRGAMTHFTYWAAPDIVSATLNTVGTAVNIIFDQSTDMGMMTSGDGACSNILHTDSLPMLAADATSASCVWESTHALNIFLGTGATLSPGDTLTLKPDTLKSSNSLSEASSAAAQVSPPEFAISPVVSVVGSPAVDPCSELTLRALADSPRPVRYQWSCRNDDELSQTLSTFTDSVVYLAAGTAEMETMDKTYEIVVTATDFLGTTSDPVVFEVFKMSSAAPKLTFDPPTVAVFREESILVKVVAEFSACPIEKGSLVFNWHLQSREFNRATGAEFTSDAAIFETTGSQLLVPGGMLDPDASYTLSITAYMENDPSKTSNGMFSMSVKRHDLVASIKGGSGLSGSLTRDLVLDASDSLDPDYMGERGTDSDLRFAWSCRYGCLDS